MDPTSAGIQQSTLYPQHGAEASSVAETTRHLLIAAERTEHHIITKVLYQSFINTAHSQREMPMCSITHVVNDVVTRIWNICLLSAVSTYRFNGNFDVVYSAYIGNRFERINTSLHEISLFTGIEFDAFACELQRHPWVNPTSIHYYDTETLLDEIGLLSVERRRPSHYSDVGNMLLSDSLLQQFASVFESLVQGRYCFFRHWDKHAEECLKLIIDELVVLLFGSNINPYPQYRDVVLRWSSGFAQKTLKSGRDESYCNWVSMILSSINRAG
jgi:hypothetical protein